MMTVDVLLFSVLQDLAGCESIRLELSGDAPTLREVMEALIARVPEIEVWREKCLLAKNLEYASLDTVVGENDEIAVMPPVQGG